MFSPRVIEAVEQATPRKRVSLVLTVHPEKFYEIADISDRNERLVRLLKLYSEEKSPIIEQFTEYEKGGLRVNVLKGTPNLIVSAPARVWKKVMRDRPPFFSDPTIEVTPNEPEFAAIGI